MHATPLPLLGLCCTTVVVPHELQGASTLQLRPVTLQNAAVNVVTALDHLVCTNACFGHCFEGEYSCCSSSSLVWTLGGLVASYPTAPKKHCFYAFILLVYCSTVCRLLHVTLLHYNSFKRQNTWWP